MESRSISPVPTTGYEVPLLSHDVLPYTRFLELLRHPECADIVRCMKDFVESMRLSIMEQRPRRQPSSSRFYTLTFNVLPPSSPVSKDHIVTDIVSFINRLESDLLQRSCFHSNRLSLSHSEDASPISTHDISLQEKKPNDFDTRESLSDVGILHSSFKTNHLTNDDDSNYHSNLQIGIREGLERLIMSKLYLVINILTKHEVKQDETLTKKLNWINIWISPKHLDLPVNIDYLINYTYKEKHLLPSSDSTTYSWKNLAIMQFSRLVTAKCPKSKLILLLNITRIVSEIALLLKRSNNLQDTCQSLHNEHIQDPVSQEQSTITILTDPSLNSTPKQLHISSSQSTTVVSADDLLPILIWLIIRTTPNDILTSIEFVSLFRHPSLLVSEDLYYFTMIASAAEFVKQLNVSHDLRIYDNETRYRIVQTCPPEELNNWIGTVDHIQQWTTIESIEPIQSINTAKTSEPVQILSNEVSQSDNLSEKWTENGYLFRSSESQLPTPFHVSTEFLTPQVYQNFLDIMHHPECDPCVSLLRRYVSAIDTISAEDDHRYSTGLPDIIKPDKIHSLISICVRILTRQTNDFHWDKLISNQSPIVEDYTGNESQAEQFKKRFGTIVVLTECLERFIFGKIYYYLFDMILHLYRTESERRSLLQILLYPFNKPQRLTQQANKWPIRLFTKENTNSSFVPSQKQSLWKSRFTLALSTILMHYPLLSDESLNDIDNFNQNKETNLIKRRMRRLDEMVSPLEKLKTFTALCRVGETLSTINSNVPNCSQVIAYVALILIICKPQQLEPHLTFVEAFRHPTLIGPELQGSLRLVRMAIATVETFSEQSIGKMSTLDAIREKLETIAERFRKTGISSKGSHDTRESDKNQIEIK